MGVLSVEHDEEHNNATPNTPASSPSSEQVITPDMQQLLVNLARVSIQPLKHQRVVPLAQ